MKFIKILVLLGIVSTVYGQGKESILLAIENYMESTSSNFRESCIEESGVDRALVEKLEGAEMTEDEKLKCYIRCQGLNSKVVDDQGHIDMAALQTVLKATNTDFLNMTDKDCKIAKSTHLCEAAYQACLCIWNVLHNHHHLH